MTYVQYPKRYVIQLEVFMHSHYETGAPLDWDVCGIKCDEWLHCTILEAFDNHKFRDEHLDHFVDLPLDASSIVAVTIDGDDYGNGWVWWIENVVVQP